MRSRLGRQLQRSEFRDAEAKARLAELALQGRIYVGRF
jgi:hypothetical protein